MINEKQILENCQDEMYAAYVALRKQSRKSKNVLALKSSDVIMRFDDAKSELQTCGWQQWVKFCTFVGISTETDARDFFA